MIIRDMFADDSNRKINGIIKVDQAANDVIEQKLNEYVITRELKKHFITFLIIIVMVWMIRPLIPACRFPDFLEAVNPTS